MGYTATVGYDAVTGLGSISAANLNLAADTQPLGPIISSVFTADGGPAIAQHTFIVIRGPRSCHHPGGWSDLEQRAVIRIWTHAHGVERRKRNC